MFPFLQAAALILMLSIPAHAQSFSERSGINSFFGISPSTQDFVTQVVQAEMFEIELSKLAEEKGNPKTKLFAAQMLKDHRQTSAQLRAMVQGGAVKVSYPTALSNTDQAQLDRLKKLSGPEFDVRFEAVQAGLHNNAIELFERYGSGGDHPDLKLFAYRHLPHLREHWRLARALRE